MVFNAQKQIAEIQKLYKQYLGNKTPEKYLNWMKTLKSWDEETTTDPLFRDMLQNEYLWGYNWDNVLLQQQKHKIVWNWETKIAKPDFETNNEFCKIPVLFDSKSSNISFEEMISGSNTVFETTFRRYLLRIKPEYKYIIWFNLEYIILYEKIDENNISTKIIVNVLKLLKEDKEEIKNLGMLLDETRFKQISMEDKITILKNKKFEDTPFNTELFFEKYINTRDKLQMFFVSRLKYKDITRDNCDIDVQRDLPDSDNDDEFREQLANRLTMIEFFKYIFIRTYEDFGLIHFSEEDKKIIPISYGKIINNLESKGQTWLFSDFLNTFFESYITKISEQWIADIWKEYFDWFLTLFKKYEWFIGDLVIDNKAKFDYYNILFDIIFFLNEFNFRELGDDIIGWLYEKTLDREDRKKFWQFYTPRYIIDFILDTLAIKPTENVKVADVSCGTGWFLVKYLDRIKWDLLNDNLKLIDIFKWVYGVDIKEFSVLLTRLNIALMFILKNKALQDYNLETKKIRLNNIIQWDGLWIQNSLPIKDWDLDYVVGNPPYVWQKWNSEIFEPIKSDSFFKEMFVKRSDFYYYFIIQWIKKLKENWKLGYIIPREWITSDSGYKLRQYILDNCKILWIIDFNWISIFEDAGTSSCLLFLQKCKNKEWEFSFVQFKNHDKKNLVKYIESNRDKLHKKTSSEYWEAKDKIDSWYEIFSNKIIKYSNFRKILDSIGRWEKFDISFLWWLTSGKLFLNDFIDIKKINQTELQDSAWLFWENIKGWNVVNLWNILTVQVWVQTWCDNVTEKHIEKWLSKKEQEWRWIFVLKEWTEIRGSWLIDIEKWKNNIWNIEINLWENWWWQKLNDNEKFYIKPLFWWKDLQKWTLNKSWEFLVFYNITNYLHSSDIQTLNKHFTNYKWPLLNRNSKWWKIITDEIINHTEDIRTLYNWDWSTLATLWKWLWNLLQKYGFWINYDKEKIITSSRANGFCYSDGVAYWLSWLNYIFIDEKNPYTKQIDSFSNRKDFLKFVNAVLNSKYMMNFLKSNNLNAITGKKIKEEIYLPKIDFEDQEDMKKYNEIVDIANQLIQLEREEDSGISLKKKWEDDILDTNWEEFKNLINSKNYELVNSPIWLEIKNWWNQYIIIWWDSDDISSKYSEWDKTIWELLWIRFSNDKEKEEKKKQSNQRIDEIVDEFYKSE